MRPVAVALLICCLIAVQFCGCTSLTGGTASAPPPKYMTDAVLRTFADIFDGTWSGVKVYIQKNAWVPDELRQAGQNPIEITTIKDLIKLHEDADVAPAIALVDASEDLDGIIRVTIKYTPVRIKGLEAVTRGGTFEYTYMMLDNKLVMLSRLKPVIKHN